MNDVQIFGAMAEGVEATSNLIARYAIVENLYLQERSDGRAQLRDSVTKLYTAILLYLSRAYQYYQQSTGSKLYAIPGDKANNFHKNGRDWLLYKRRSKVWIYFFVAYLRRILEQTTFDRLLMQNVPKSKLQIPRVQGTLRRTNEFQVSESRAKPLRR